MTLTALPAPDRTQDDGPIRVIFADDSAAMRTLARFALSARAGFELVGEACDGAEALSLLKSHDADCVILDVEMPNVSGFEALAQLQRSRPALPVIMLSGYADPVLTRRAQSEGAAAYLEKNNGLGQLAETVRRVTQQSIVTSVEERVQAAEPDARLAVVPPPPGRPSTAAADLLRLEYVISHDFAEPARILNGFSRLLEQRYADQLGDSGRLFVGNIQSAAARLQLMIDDLLVYSRAGRLEPALGPVDLTAVVRQTYQKLSVEHPEAQLDLGSLPTVAGDPTLLATVMTSLVRNALLFNTSPAPRVQIEAHVADDGAIITVSDNGIGLAARHCENVFDLFRRLNTREEYPGTGTGLALCRRLMTLQHSTITLDSATGTGTTVTLVMPLSGPLPPATPALENGEPS